LMLKMPAEAVQALLNFIYYDGVELPLRDAVVAFELLKFAVEYEMESLEHAMKQLFTAASIQWYTLQVALDVVNFSGDRDDYEDVKKAATAASTIKA